MHSGSKKANRLFGYDMGPASDVQTPIVDPIVRKSTKLFFFETIGISHRVSPPASFSSQYTTSFFYADGAERARGVREAGAGVGLRLNMVLAYGWQLFDHLVV